MSKAVSTALAEAVARMEANRGTGVALGSAASKPKVGLMVREDGGGFCLPPTPWVAPASPELALKLRGIAAERDPEPVRDDAGFIIARPSPAGPVTATPALRAEAVERVRTLDAILGYLAERDVIEEWMQLWAPHCLRQTGVEYADREAAIIFAVQNLPAIAFCEDTARLCSQQNRFLPLPADAYEQLMGWLRPWQAERDAAHAIATARNADGPGRERPVNAPLSAAEVEERRRAAAATVERHYPALSQHRAEVSARCSAPREDRPMVAPSAYQQAWMLAGMVGVNGTKLYDVRPRLKVVLGKLLQEAIQAVAAPGAVGEKNRAAWREMRDRIMANDMLGPILVEVEGEAATA